MRTDETVVGATALVVLALANAGVDADEQAMKKALTWLREQTPTDTYSVSLQTQALAMVSPKQDLAILERNTRWLEDRQSSGPGVTGGWSYGANRSGADNSNSQFAILGLHEAQRAGVRCKPECVEVITKILGSCTATWMAHGVTPPGVVMAPAA